MTMTDDLTPRDDRERAIAREASRRTTEYLRPHLNHTVYADAEFIAKRVVPDTLTWVDGPGGWCYAVNPAGDLLAKGPGGEERSTPAGDFAAYLNAWRAVHPEGDQVWADKDGDLWRLPPQGNFMVAEWKVAELPGDYVDRYGPFTPMRIVPDPTREVLR
jgi:hypothetical protein